MKPNIQSFRYALRLCVLALITILIGCPIPTPSVTPLSSDVAVSGLSVSPSNVEVGSTIEISVTVSNIGEADAPATTLRFYRNPGGARAINENSTEIGMLPVPALAEDASEPYMQTFTVPNTPANYNFGVCVDPVENEERRENNCTSALQGVTVTERNVPDLLVQTPMASPNSIIENGTVNIILTVNNMGTAPAPASTLRVYLSNSPTITTSNTIVGEAVNISALSSESNTSAFSSITVPSTPGTYYYGACVAPVTDELNTSNNCSPGTMVIVMPRPKPDLVPQNLQFSPPQRVFAGQTLSISLDLRNDGTAPSTDGTILYYQSADATISSADTQVGVSSIGFLNNGNTSNRFSVDILVPSEPDTYYYGVCINGVSGEDIADNNCSIGMAVMVARPPTPDITLLNASLSSTMAFTGNNILFFRVNALNIGAVGSVASTVRFYRSLDSTISDSDTEIGTISVGRLNSGESSESLSIDNIIAPNAIGRYYYGACIDSVPNEVNQNNNCSEGVLLTVSLEPKPDLLLQNPMISPSSTVYVGETITFSVHARNAGNAVAESRSLTFYRSDDSTVDTSDMVVGNISSTGRLDGGETSNTLSSGNIIVPTTPGTYYYAAHITPLESESDPNNNTSAVQEVIVRGRPDLVTQDLVLMPSTVDLGETFSISVRVRNAGNGNAPASNLRFYRSDDPTITTSDTTLGTPQSIGILNTGSISSVFSSGDLIAPSTAGMYYYGVCIETVMGEENTVNNCNGVTLNVEPNTPDITLQNLMVSAGTVYTGETITILVQANNTGTGDAPASTIVFYQSIDQTITTGDTEVGRIDLESLMKGESSATLTSGNISVPTMPDTYYYGARVIPVTRERNTDNNITSDGVQVIVAGRPDIEIGTVSVSLNSVFIGETITISAQVRNAGNGAVPAGMLQFYYSTDPTIDGSDTPVGISHSTAGLSSSGTTFSSGTITVPNTPNTYYFGAYVQPVTGEVINDNNGRGTAVTVGGRPDIEIVNVTASPNLVIVGETITISAQVRNTGTGVVPAGSLNFYYSTDPTIDSSDTPVDSASITNLSSSGTTFSSGAITVPNTPGTHYYGAYAQPVTGEIISDNNSRGVAVTVEERPDIRVRNFQVDKPNVAPNENFRLTVSTENIGGRQSTTYIPAIEYYRSTNMASVFNGSPFRRGNATEVFNESTEGTYYYGVSIVSVSGETNESNNRSSIIEINVRGVPDLRVTNLSHSPSTIVQNGDLEVTVTVVNRGNGIATPTISGGHSNIFIRYYLSRTSDYTRSIVQEHSYDLGRSINSGVTIRDNTRTFAISSSLLGTYYYAVCVDATERETVLNNSCSSPVEIEIVRPARPIMSLDNLRISTGGFRKDDDDITVGVRVNNTGNARFNSGELRFQRSSDRNFNSRDPIVGRVNVGFILANGGNWTHNFVEMNVSDGTWYFKVCLYESSSSRAREITCVESSRSQSVTITTPRPIINLDNLRISTGSGSSSDDVNVSVRVSNSGNARFDGGELRFQRSSDDNFNSRDPIVGRVNVGWIFAGRNWTHDFNERSVPTGTWYYEVCLYESSSSRAREIDCVESSRSVTIAPRVPNLELYDISASTGFASFPFDTRDDVTISVRVRNTGNARFNGGVLHFQLSTDRNFNSSDILVGGSGGVSVGSINANSRAFHPFRATRIDVPRGRYYIGVCLSERNGGRVITCLNNSGRTINVP